MKPNFEMEVNLTAHPSCLARIFQVLESACFYQRPKAVSPTVRHALREAPRALSHRHELSSDAFS
jgi:hypothetical protein